MLSSACCIASHHKPKCQASVNEPLWSFLFWIPRVACIPQYHQCHESDHHRLWKTIRSQNRTGWPCHQDQASYFQAWYPDEQYFSLHDNNALQREANGSSYGQSQLGDHWWISLFCLPQSHLRCNPSQGKTFVFLAVRWTHEAWLYFYVTCCVESLAHFSLDFCYFQRLLWSYKLASIL